MEEEEIIPRINEEEAKAAQDQAETSDVAQSSIFKTVLTRVAENGEGTPLKSWDKEKNLPDHDSSPENDFNGYSGGSLAPRPDEHVGLSDIGGWNSQVVALRMEAAGGATLVANQVVTSLCLIFILIGS